MKYLLCMMAVILFIFQPLQATAAESHSITIAMKMVNTGSDRSPKSKVIIQNSVWVALGRPTSSDFYIIPSTASTYHYRWRYCRVLCRAHGDGYRTGDC